MNIKKLLPELIEKINKHHELYRFPVKAELWEDIFDQVIKRILQQWLLAQKPSTNQEQLLYLLAKLP